MFRHTLKGHRRLMLLGCFSLKRHRGYATSATAAPTPHPVDHLDAILALTYAGFDPRLILVFAQLDLLAPRFVLLKGDIEILNDPKQFYRVLCEKITLARKRVFLLLLYFGKEETDLVAVLDKALAATEDLQVLILLDGLRGTRESPDPCSASVLAPLVAKYGAHRVDLRLYRTPQLGRYTEKLAPKRLVEGVGLQHMKIYGFDDEVMLSGANLLRDYFVDRQDRYYLFKHLGLSDYYFTLQDAVSKLLYQVVPRRLGALPLFRLDWPTLNKLCEPRLNVERFLIDSQHLLTPLLKQDELKLFDEHTEGGDTIVYPVLQLTPLMAKDNDASTEKPAVLRVLSYMDLPKIHWWFTAGYFNMLPLIQRRLLNGKSSGDVITASPQANLFYQSAGISYYLPQAYLLFAKKFLERIRQAGKQATISVWEWRRGVVNTPGGWSYHAKGIWGTAPNEKEPTLTVVGSLNYTKRAYSCDLETNAVVITKDPELKLAMKHEIDHLMEHAHKMSLDEFEPKPVEVVGADGKPHTKLEVPEHRRIAKGVPVAVKVLSDRL